MTGDNIDGGENDDTFSSDEFPYVGTHFVAFKQQEDVGTYYNLYAGSVRPASFSRRPHSFLSSRKRFMPIMILIYGHQIRIAGDN